MFASQALTGFSAAAFLLVATAVPVAAAETTCRGKLGQVTVDDLRVPRNATCELDRTKVKGSIMVESGGALIASRVVVIGDVQATEARVISLVRKSRIGGSVQIVRGRRAKVANSEIDGNVRIESAGGVVEVSTNAIGGNVKVSQNSAGVTIEDNDIDGNLLCKGNRPGPVGGGNKVQGNQEDQCRRL